MIKTIIVLSGLFTTSIFANISLANNSNDTLKTKNKWNSTWIMGLNISQVAFSNWVKGGENSVNWTIHSRFKSIYKSKIWTLKNDYKIEYGRTKLGDGNFRTNNNEIYFESVLSNNVGWFVDPFFGNSIKTQVTKGYDYKKDPNKSIVDFFDPGYVTQSFGFTYDKLEFGRTRFGIAVQEVFSNIHIEYTDDKLTENIERFKLETGIEAVTDGELILDTNIKLQTKLRLFSRFERLDVWDVYWSNNIVSKINSYLQVSFDFHLIYEKAQSIETQIKEAFQLGIIYNII